MVGFVDIQGQAITFRLNGSQGGGKVGVVEDFGEEGAEGLFDASAKEAAPFVGAPKTALGVGGFAFFGFEEGDGADALGGGLFENFSGSLGAGQTEEEVDGETVVLGVLGPVEGEAEAVGLDGEKGPFASRTVDCGGVELVSGLAAEDVAEVEGSGVVVREEKFGLRGVEEDEVHGGESGGKPEELVGAEGETVGGEGEVEAFGEVARCACGKGGAKVPFERKGDGVGREIEEAKDSLSAVKGNAFEGEDGRVEAMNGLGSVGVEGGEEGTAAKETGEAIEDAGGRC